MTNVEIRRVEVEAIRPLRHRVLRPGRPLESAHFAGDDTAIHFAAYAGDAVIGCVSMMAAPYPAGDEPEDRQLRGMAADAAHRGRGVGSALVAAVIDAAPARIWCNARIEAAGLYRRAGFVEVGEPFQVPDVGPHLLMLRRTA